MSCDNNNSELKCNKSLPKRKNFKKKNTFECLLRKLAKSVQAHTTPLLELVERKALAGKQPSEQPVTAGALG